MRWLVLFVCSGVACSIRPPDIPPLAQSTRAGGPPNVERSAGSESWERRRSLQSRAVAPPSQIAVRRLVEDLFLCLRTGEPALADLATQPASLHFGPVGQQKLRPLGRRALLEALEQPEPEAVSYDPSSLVMLEDERGRGVMLTISRGATPSKHKKLSIWFSDSGRLSITQVKVQTGTLAELERSE